MLRIFLPLLTACAIEANAPGGACAVETWHLDRDGDGHGDGRSTFSDCEPPPGYVASADDCADDDPNLVDGCWPEGELAAEDADATLTVSGPSITTALLPNADLTGDGAPDFVVSTYSFGEGDYPSAIYVVSADAAGSRELVDAAVAVFGSGEEDYLAVEWLASGDLNGDGFTDLVYGENGEDVFASFGPFAAQNSLGAVWLPDSQADAVAVAPDTDGSGNDELVVGVTAPSADESIFAYVLDAVAPGDAAIVDRPYAAWRAEDGSTIAVSDIASGEDLDGDGIGDVVLAAQYAGNLSQYAMVYPGPLARDRMPDDAIETLFPPDGAEITALALTPDIDGDGLSDVVTGHAGAAVDGKAEAGVVVAWANIGREAVTLALVQGDAADGWVGLDVGGADIDDDGAVDLVVAGRGGAVSLYFGAVRGVLEAADADTTIPQREYGLDDEVNRILLGNIAAGPESDLTVVRPKAASTFYGARR